MQMILEISCVFYFPDGKGPPCWIFKSIKFYMLRRSGGSRHVTVPDFLETGPSIAEILRFFDFPDGCRRHLVFLNSQNFIGCQSPEGWHASPFQISSKLVNLLWRYCNFFAAATCWIFEIAKFYWLTGSRLISMLNIVKIWRLQSY